MSISLVLNPQHLRTLYVYVPVFFLWLHMHASNNNGTPLYKKWYIKPWEPVVRGRNAGKNIPLNPLLLLRDPEGENGGRH